jgi:hypothetical protein
MNHPTTDLGYRIEIRAEAPDPSLPASGRLVAYAYRPADSDRWVMRHRDGREATAADRYQAAGMLLSLVFATDPCGIGRGDHCTCGTGRGDHWRCATCDTEYEAYSEDHAAANHNLYEDHPWDSGDQR